MKRRTGGGHEISKEITTGYKSLTQNSIKIQLFKLLVWNTKLVSPYNITCMDRSEVFWGVEMYSWLVIGGAHCLKNWHLISRSILPDLKKIIYIDFIFLGQISWPKKKNMLSFFNHLLFITLMNIKSLTKPDLKKKFVLFFNFDNQMGMGWDLCVGLLYEHRFAMLITSSKKK